MLIMAIQLMIQCSCFVTGPTLQDSFKKESKHIPVHSNLGNTPRLQWMCVWPNHASLRIRAQSLHFLISLPGKAWRVGTFYCLTRFTEKKPGEWKEIVGQEQHMKRTPLILQLESHSLLVTMLNFRVSARCDSLQRLEFCQKWIGSWYKTGRP